MSTAFLITSLVVVATPGAGVVYTLSAGLSGGRRASVVAALGCTLGIVPHVAAAASGLAALLHASAIAFQTLKYAGVAYLLYMAWTMYRHQHAIDLQPGAGAGAAPRSAARTIGSAILINILNPKLTMFFLAFLPQFIAPGEPRPLPRMVALSLVFMLLTFVVFTGYGIFAAAVKRHLTSHPRIVVWLRRSFAAAFIALGARLAFAQR